MKIQLATGITFENIGTNGTWYASKVELDKSVFDEEALKSVSITNGDNVTTLTNQDVCFGLPVDDDLTLFMFYPKGSDITIDDRVTINTSDITDIQEALAELSELIGG